MITRNDEGQRISGRTQDIIGVIPYIRIHDYVFSKSEIVSLQLETIGFLPRIEIRIETATNTLNDVNKINDGDLVQIGIRSDLKYFKAISADFLIDYVVTNETSSDNSDGMNRYYIKGHLWIPNLMSDNIHYNFQGKAEDALKDACQRIGLGYVENANTDNCERNTRTFTTMTDTWNCTKNVRDFIAFVTEHMWAGSDSFFDSWIDPYYNLVNVNVGDMLGRKVEDDGISIFTKYRSIIQTSGSDGKYAHNDLESDKFYKDNKLLINEKSAQTSVWYVTDYKIVNQSTEISQLFSTQHTASIYVQNNGVGQSTNDAEHQVNIGVFYNQEKLQLGYVTMNGPAEADKYYKNADNGNWREQNTKKSAPIMMPINSDEDGQTKEAEKSNKKASGNVSKGYVLAPEHNKINLAELEKQILVVHTNGFNNGLAKGEKIPCVLFRQTDERWLSEKNEINDNTALFDPIASGWFYVKGIRYIYTPSQNVNNVMTDWRTEILLTRREWFPPVPTSTNPKSTETQKLNDTALGGTSAVTNAVSPTEAVDVEKQTQMTSPTPSRTNEQKGIEQEANENIRLQKENKEAIEALDKAEQTEELQKEITEADNTSSRSRQDIEQDKFNTETNLKNQQTQLLSTTSKLAKSKSELAQLKQEYADDLTRQANGEISSNAVNETKEELDEASKEVNRLENEVTTLKKRIEWNEEALEKYQKELDALDRQ